MFITLFAVALQDKRLAFKLVLMPRSGDTINSSLIAASKWHFVRKQNWFSADCSGERVFDKYNFFSLFGLNRFEQRLGDAESGSKPRARLQAS